MVRDGAPDSASALPGERLLIMRTECSRLTFAAALIVTLPVQLLTVFAQRQIVAGLTAGAVKGG